MKYDDIIAVLQAQNEGKEIESRARWDHSEGWRLVTEDFCNFISCEYRIKPAPFEPITGWCFPRDVRQEPTCGMIKVEQQQLSAEENPIRSKPRDFWITVGGQVWQEEQDAHNWFRDESDFKKRVIHVREVLE